MYILILTAAQIENDPIRQIEVLRALDRHGEWEALANGVYAVNSEGSEEDIRSDLRNRLGIADSISIVPLKDTSGTLLPGRIKEWIKHRLGSPEGASPGY